MGNYANGGQGGGLSVVASLMSLISGTLIANNTVTNASSQYDGGGGIYSNAKGYQGSPPMKLGAIVNSTIVNNSVSNTSTAVATGADNVGGSKGGGILNLGDIGRIANTTIAGNKALEAGGFYQMTYSNVTTSTDEMVNTIVAGNTSLGSFPNDIQAIGKINAARYNLVGDARGHQIANGVDGNIVGVAAKLGPLAKNGGPTWTMALAVGSPAIDAGLTDGAFATDQRGLPRPSNGRVDIGAFERQGTNQAPVASDSVVSTGSGAPRNALLTATDPDYDPISFAVVTGPSHGTIQLDAAAGTFLYTPAAGYSGPDSFTFKASDTVAESNIATVRITVYPPNSPPVAASDSYVATKNVFLVVASPGVLANDTDADGDTLKATLFIAPSHGTLSFESTGGFVYTPAANYQGPDAFIITPRTRAVPRS